MPSAAHARARSTQRRAGPCVTDPPRVEEDDGRRRRLDAVLRLAEHRRRGGAGPSRPAARGRPVRARARCTAVAWLSGMVDPDRSARRGSANQETIRSNVGSGVAGVHVEERLLPGYLRRTRRVAAPAVRPARAELPPLSGQQQLPRGQALLARPRSPDGSRSAPVAPRTRCPAPPPSHRRWPLPNPRPHPPAASPIRWPDPRRKAHSARCSRRNALPVAHGSHSTRSSTAPPRASSAAAKVAPTRSPTTATRSAPRAAGIVDGTPDAVQPLRHEVAGRSRCRRNLLCRHSPPERGPARRGQSVSQVTQRACRVRGLQPHESGTGRRRPRRDHRREIQPGEERPLGRPEPSREGTHSRRRNVGRHRPTSSRDASPRPCRTATPKGPATART